MPYWRLHCNVLSIRHQLCRQRKNVPSLKDCALLAPALQCAVHQTSTVPSTKECAVTERLRLTGTCITMCRLSSINCAINERLCLTRTCISMYLLSDVYTAAIETLCHQRKTALLAPAVECAVHQTSTMSHGNTVLLMK